MRDLTNSGTHELIPEPADSAAICAKCDERMPVDTLLVHLAVCQGIDVTRADEWEMRDETGE